jgi:peptidoglycan biosynthesis protein MviN/MurJ (putative lipid II flippase)
MIVPFAMLYTKGVYDVNYSRTTFAMIATLAGAFSCFRIPYQAIVEAAGHYRQTRNGALFEAALNITISLIAVAKLGIVGVAIGSLAATIFRSVQYAWYLSKNLIPRSIWIFFGHIAVTGVVAVLTVAVSNMFLNWEVQNFIQWIQKAFLVAVVSAVFTVALNAAFYGKDMIYLLSKIKNMRRK